MATIPEKILWQAVVWRAFADACRPGESPEVIKNRQAAQAWLLSQGEYFNFICGLADFDPAYIYEGAQTCAHNNWPRSPIATVA